MQPLALACNAMATRFEIVLPGEDEVRLRAAGEEALEEICRLDAQLSFYRPSSELRRINAHAADGPVRVEPSLFRLLQHAQWLSKETNGAFDITVAPLMRCWGFVNDTGKLPHPDELAEARGSVGMHLVKLNEHDFTVQFERNGVLIDLGAIGKGYALERAAGLLRDAGVTCALLHGGTSTVYGLGKPPGSEGWKVAIDAPPDNFRNSKGSPSLTSAPTDGKTPNHLATVSLTDEALSVSAVWGKSFTVEGKVYGHVLDPRTGQPVGGTLLAAVVLPSATETDALSTALLTMGGEGHDQIANLRAGIRTLLLLESDPGGPLRPEARGIDLSPPG